VTTKIVIGMEMQIPYHDGRMFARFLDWMDGYKPDQLIMIGDFLDVPGPSRWNKGTAMEYAATLQTEVDRAKDLLGVLRFAQPNIWIGYHTDANHESRIQNYINRYAPALSGVVSLRLSSLLDLDGFVIEELPKYYDAAPGLVTTHGDKEVLSKYGGGTAISGARNKGKSLVCGHTHRHGLIYERFGRKTIFGMETGHMMAVKKADYIKNDNPNWSAGWGVVEVNGTSLSPSIITYRNGKVDWNG